jgi:hypothetical protein
MAVSAASQNKRSGRRLGPLRRPSSLGRGRSPSLALQSGAGEAPGSYSGAGRAGAGSEEARDRNRPAAAAITIALVPLSGVRPWPCSGRRGRQTPGSQR